MADPMEADEGYSEHPLNPPVNVTSTVESRLAMQLDPDGFGGILAPHISRMSVAQKHALVIAILYELPTHMIDELVQKHLNPRLYIDFVGRLPTEICLKIFGYLDPLSLISVAMCGPQWFDLALDRKLWEKLYYMEGWRANIVEVVAAENRVNEELALPSSSTAGCDTFHLQRSRSSEFSHTRKKRVVESPPPAVDSHRGAFDEDARDESMDIEMTGSSVFGGQQAQGLGGAPASNSTTSVDQSLGMMVVESPTSGPIDRKSKGKGKASTKSVSFGGNCTIPDNSPESARVPKLTLWSNNFPWKHYHVNWHYLYTMRRRLESNWDTGKFVKFQLPHRDHPEEAHEECIYTIQFTGKHLVSGSRDRTLRIWDLETCRLVRILRGHQASVLCLQFDPDPSEDLIVSGSSDARVILWSFSTGEIVQRLEKVHRESVLNVKFDKRILVTCSKDRTIKIFNRQPLRAGDLGYGPTDDLVGPVPINMKDYDNESPLDQLPIKPPFTQIACLEGHGAAVNAVQICGEEIVSASGDRLIKVWDWPTQECRRTFMGHSKGIACVQYDGRRIVSGSSDNEVKVFDRHTGLEVASLRAHSQLVRTVQAGFADLPTSVEDDSTEAEATDRQYFQAVNAGQVDHDGRSRRRISAGSRRPEDITGVGGKLPPGGGGGPYARIVSGSYDTNIIIWRRSRDGIWHSCLVLRQEPGVSAAAAVVSAAIAAAGLARVPRVAAPRDAGQTTVQSNPRPPPAPPLLHHNVQPVSRPSGVQSTGPTPSGISAPPSSPSMPERRSSLTHVEYPIHATVTPQTTASYIQMIHSTVPEGPESLRSALRRFPTMLSYSANIESAISQEPERETRLQLRQVLNDAMLHTQLSQSRIVNGQSVEAGSSATAQLASSSSMAEASSHAAHLSTRTEPRSASPSVATSSRTTMPAAMGRFRAGRRAAEGHGGTAANDTANAVAGPSTASSTSAGEGPQWGARRRPAGASRQWPAPQAQLHQQARVAEHMLRTTPTPAGVSRFIFRPQMPDGANPARVFKLQFDARRIICCSQNGVIVGWDFCNGDAELQHVSRFFGTIE